DITVEYHGMPSSAQMLGTLRAQAQAPQLDVAIMDITVAKTATDEGIFAPIDESVTQHVKDLYPMAFLEGSNAVGVTLDSLVMLYNKEALAETPTSWEEFWKPEHEGRIAITAVPDLMGILLTIIVDRMEGGTDYGSSVEKGIEKMMKLAPAIQTWEPRPDVYQPIATGSADLGLGWNARGQIYSEMEGSKLGVALPQEGSAFQINAIALVANAPNTEAAKKFIDYALSPEAQAAFTNEMFYAPINRKATEHINPEAMNRTAVSMIDKMIELDWETVAKIREDITNEWRRRVI